MSIANDQKLKWKDDATHIQDMNPPFVANCNHHEYNPCLFTSETNYADQIAVSIGKIPTIPLKFSYFCHFYRLL